MRRQPIRITRAAQRDTVTTAFTALCFTRTTNHRHCACPPPPIPLLMVVGTEFKARDQIIACASNLPYWTKTVRPGSGKKRTRMFGRFITNPNHVKPCSKYEHVHVQHDKKTLFSRHFFEALVSSRRVSFSMNIDRHKHNVLHVFRQRNEKNINQTRRCLTFSVG